MLFYRQCSDLNPHVHYPGHICAAKAAKLNSNVPFQYLTEHKDFWVINKPSGLAMLADRTNEQNLWSQFKADHSKPYLVHRLDKGTSGVLFIARNQATQTKLTKMFAQRQVNKYYLALVVGKFPMGHSYHIELPLCKGRKNRYRVAGAREQISQHNRHFTVVQDRDGVDAISKVRCLAQTETHSLVLVKPVTGRTHQLRVHLAWLGYPIMGDHLYGQPKAAEQQAQRLMLHCHRMVVPEFGTFSAARPERFELS